MTQPAASSSALPVTVDALAAQLILLYSQAEQQILVEFARLIDVVAPEVLLTALRREAQRIVTDIQVKSWPLAQRLAVVAAQRGDEAALSELRRVTQSSELLSGLLLDDPAIALGPRLGTELAARLQATLPRITQFADAAFHAATIDEAVQRLQRGGVAPNVAQRDAWRKLTERGITGFTDKAGRQWNLATYVEMATRTGLQQAFNDAHLQRMVSAGVQQFTVPSDGHPCPLCKPWQGRVLTLNGPSPTIAEAKLAGLFHPNCKHTLVAYFPGISKFAPPSPWTAADQVRYDATQKMRAMEREVRAHRRVAAAALTELDRRRAERYARVVQSRIRQHAKAHRLNQRPRCQELDLGNS